MRIFLRTAGVFVAGLVGALADFADDRAQRHQTKAERYRRIATEIRGMSGAINTTESERSAGDEEELPPVDPNCVTYSETPKNKPQDPDAEDETEE